ncbi:hypothetical protein NKH77_38740 [Streptomyces sp. M19]
MPRLMARVLPALWRTGGEAGREVVRHVVDAGSRRGSARTAGRRCCGPWRTRQRCSPRRRAPPRTRPTRARAMDRRRRPYRPPAGAVVGVGAARGDRGGAGADRDPGVGVRGAAVPREARSGAAAPGLTG